MDLRKLDRLNISLPAIDPARKRLIKLVMALVVVLPASWATIGSLERAWELQSLAQALAPPNSGFDDVGRRLSVRFANTTGDGAAGLYRMEVSRSASGWWAGSLILALISVWSWQHLARRVWQVWSPPVPKSA